MRPPESARSTGTDVLAFPGRPRRRRGGRRRPGAYDRAFAAALTGLDRQLETLTGEWAAAEVALAELLALPSAHRRPALRSGRFACTWPLCQLLVDAAEQRMAGRPDRAQKLAALAIVGAGDLDPTAYGRGLIEDLKARAWSALGEALRRRRRLAAAAAALAMAAGHLDAGSGDPLEEAALEARRAALAAGAAVRRPSRSPRRAAPRPARRRRGGGGEVVRD